MEALKFRCPECRRLYSVGSGEIKSSRPKFKCTTCQTVFCFSFPPQDKTAAEVATFKMEPASAAKKEALPQKQTPTEESFLGFFCPQCQHPNQKGVLECQKCGLIFAKMKKKEEAAAASSPSMTVVSGGHSGPAASSTPPNTKGKNIQIVGNEGLRIAWEKVISDYDNIPTHETFINRCYSEKNLPFASQQYRFVLEANPQDAIALKMREKLINLTTLTYVPPKREEEESGGRWGLTGILGVVGILMIGTGVVFSEMRTLIAVGAALVAMGLGVRYLLPR